MKILLSWLLDYLDCPKTTIDIDRIVHLFNIRTAEIESYEKVTFDSKNFYAVQIVTTKDDIEALCPELNKTILLPFRSDGIVGKWYLVTSNNQAWAWAVAEDFAPETSGIVPALHFTADQQKGSWRENIPAVDYILDIDNKSINHRPDLWGHYGIAREVAAFLDVPLKPLEAVLAKIPVIPVDTASKQELNGQLSVALQIPDHCTRFAALQCNDVKTQDSCPWMTIRLLRVGAKPVSAIVDITNYVMFDIGHPMHVFDAQAFAKNSIIIRMAKAGETLQLLDGQEIKLTTHDVVIANDEKAISLAGIMGGKTSGFQSTTKNIVLEAAGFNPLTIRKTAQRYKLRTEASMRFEKHLDPMQNIIALQRFVFLAQQLHILSNVTTPIISAGNQITPKTCRLLHVDAEKNLGISLKPIFIQKSLESLGFKVIFDNKTQSYDVVIPTYRMTKDINIQQDLIEEIIRLYGFENIISQLPMHATQPTNTDVVRTISAVKRHLAYGLHMHEVRDYLLYDASFIAHLDIDIKNAVRVKNPLSQNWTTLVTSLVPHLLKSVTSNTAANDHLRFFEYNRIWHKQKDTIVEQQSLAGIIFDKKNINFYDAKAELQSLWDLLKITVTWQKPTNDMPHWYNKNQTAMLSVNNECIGWAGMLSDTWMHPATKGSAFVFEIDGTFLQHHKTQYSMFKPWSKYQDVSYDISLLIPIHVNVDSLKNAIIAAHQLIQSADVVDFFEKEEWVHERAVTIRYKVSSFDKTLSKQELDEVIQSVNNAIVQHHAKIR